MKNFPSVLIAIVFVMTGSAFNQARACYANFSHTNACVGDTVWFYGLDFSAVHVWDFGDTTVNNPNLAFDDTAYHVFTVAGTFYVTHFVNIGAEWAYETQEVTIGTDCFGAAFHPQCGGSLYVAFQNQSTGGNLTYSWNFGEPSSGTADTSSAMGPYHYYAAPGSYLVTLIIDNGINTDTSIQTVVVDTSCMSAFVSYMLNPCAGDTAFFYYNFNGVNSVYWDFGDPASGISNYSTLLSPTHIFASPGVYVGMVIYSNGIDADTLPVVTRVVDCSVWPGDANRDGIVSGEDFFAVALYYGDTGSVRNNASTIFTAQPAVNWTNSTNWAYMYLQDLMDKKFADCNGDGTIDAADAAVIIQNFGMSHQTANNLSSMMITNSSDPWLRVSLPALVSGLSTITADISYGDSLVHTPVYGFCIYVDYDPLQVDAASIAVDFSGTFLDSVSVSNLIIFENNDQALNRLVIVAARKDHNGINAFGHLASITFNAAPGYSGTLGLHIGSDSKVMSNSVYPGSTFGNVQNIFKVNTEDASTQVSLGIHELDTETSVSIFPSPARDFFRLDVLNVSGSYSVRIIDATGRVLSSMKPVTNHQHIDIRDLSTGIYFIRLDGNGWNVNTKLAVER